MSKTPGSSIAGPSQQKPNERSRQYKLISSLNRTSSLLSPSDESVRSFSFRVETARVLKQAIQALCYSETTIAHIHVDEQGFKITVVKEEEGSTFDGFLLLSASDLINFQSRRPSSKKLDVNLAAVSWRLAPVDDQDTLTIYQVEGSDEISVMCERSVPRSRLSINFKTFHPNLSAVRLQEMDPPDDNFTSFSFQLKPARILKQAILLLCDSGVNEKGLACIHVNDKGFKITVDTNVYCTGVLSLPASKLTNFRCSKPNTVAQIVNLPELSWNLSPVDDEDTVTIFHVVCSDTLSFISAQKSFAWSISVYNVPENIGKLPEIIPFCEGRMLSHDVSRVFREVLHEAAKRRTVVAVEIEHGSLRIDLVTQFDFVNDCGRFMRNTQREKYRAWFYCKFATAMEKACELVDMLAEVQVYVSLVPTTYVVFRFNLAEVGDLQILKRTCFFHPPAENIKHLKEGSRMLLF